MTPAWRDDDDGDALFVKDGVPVKFCFHRSVTQGRGQITRDVERHGGQIVSDERTANVLLVDEQEDIAFLRRRYYSSTELYRLSLYVEPRGFVRLCIRSGTYQHIGPTKQGMPGIRPGTRRTRVPFTEEDRDHLAYYLATRCPTRDGRMGNSAYKDLERLGQSEDPSWAWVRRHTFHSWREHYKMHPEMMDPRIDHYLQQLKGIGHHFGYDPRSHDYRKRRQQLAGEEEEEESEEEEQEQRHGRERREEPGPAVAPPRRRDQVARDYLVRHEKELVTMEDEEGDVDMQEEEVEVAVQEPQDAKRRVQPDGHRPHDSSTTQAKRARVSDALSSEEGSSGVEADQGESGSAREDTVMEESQEIEGSDLFGDRAYQDEAHFDFDDQDVEFLRPFSPEVGLVPEQDGPFLPTQATLVASPRRAEKEPSPAPVWSPKKVVEAPAQTPPPPTVPPSSQQTVVVAEERIVVQRAHVLGTSAQPGPSMPRERATRGGATADAPYRNTRARSRSVEPQPQPAQRREDRKAKAKWKEEALIEEVNEEESEDDGDAGSVPVTGAVSVPESLGDEMAVEGLLEASVGKMGEEAEVGEHVEDSDESSDGDGMSGLPRLQEVEVGSEPSDSDDVETHGSLVQGAIRDETAVVGKVGDESGSEQEKDDDDDEDRIERMAGEKLRTSPMPTPPEPRMIHARAAATRARTQTQTQTQTQTSPRRTRSGSCARATQAAVFPSPGTKARAVVDRMQEEGRRMPYAPPPGSQAAKVVRAKGRRG